MLGKRASRYAGFRGMSVQITMETALRLQDGKAEKSPSAPIGQTVGKKHEWKAEHHYQKITNLPKRFKQTEHRVVHSHTPPRPRKKSNCNFN